MRRFSIALSIAAAALLAAGRAHAEPVPPDDDPGIAAPAPTPAPTPAPVAPQPQPLEEEEPEPAPVYAPQPMLVPLLVPPPPPPRPTPFDRGKISLGFGLSTQSTFEQRYVVVGGGLGYYILRGLEPSLHAVHWFGGEPSVTELSPQLRYVFVGAPFSLKPYIGGFFNRWFISDRPNVDTVGARLGVLSYGGSSGFVIGLGVIYEHVISECTSGCDTYYPDLTVNFSL